MFSLFKQLSKIKPSFIWLILFWFSFFFFHKRKLLKRYTVIHINITYIGMHKIFVNVFSNEKRIRKKQTEKLTWKMFLQLTCLSFDTLLHKQKIDYSSSRRPDKLFPWTNCYFENVIVTQKKITLSILNVKYQSNFEPLYLQWNLWLTQIHYSHLLIFIFTFK